MQASPKHWRARAQEARAVAHMQDDKDDALQLLHIADCYEELARMAEVRIEREKERIRGVLGK